MAREELEILLALLNGGDLKGVSRDSIASPSVWALARLHGVYNLCARALLLLPGVRENNGLCSKIEADLRQGVALEMVRWHEIRQFAVTLQHAGIPFLIFKGAALAHSHYDEPFLRERVDCDVLFASKVEAEFAWKLLDTKGYLRPTAIPGELATAEFTCQKPGKTGVRESFDMHWHTNNSARFRVGGFDDLYRNGAPIKDEFPFIRVPSPVDALLLACQHRLAHGVEGTHNRLIWLYDIHLLVNAFTTGDWKKLMKVANETGVFTAIADGMLQGRQFFNTKIPAPELELLESYARSSESAGLIPQSLLAHDLQAIAEFSGFRNKWRFLRENLFPPVAFMKARYPNSHPWCLYWLYVRRIVGGGWKRLRLHLFGRGEI